MLWIRRLFLVRFQNEKDSKGIYDTNQKNFLYKILVTIEKIKLQNETLGR